MSKFITLSKLKTALTPLISLIDKKAERPSWNENDPNSNSYIADRTHYKETNFVNHTLNITNDFTSYDISLPAFVEGKTYKILWDGIEYNCTAYIASAAGVPCVGNDTLAMGAGNTGGNGEPFGILVFNGQNIIGADIAGEHTIGLIDTVVHKIPSEYLPEIIGKKGIREYSEIFNDYERNIADGEYAHAEGRDTTASGNHSHAEGRDTTASGNHSHAEGYHTTASGSCSHAEGDYTTASGSYSHAEGDDTTASGSFSHAEGYHTTASGSCSHAEGYHTTASGVYQHSQGKHNIADSSSKYAHIVGNGTSSSKRSNAHTIDWNGLGWFAGGLKVGGTGQEDADAKSIATETYVDEKIAAIDVSGQIAEHNISTTAHNDIRDLIAALKDGIAFKDQVNGYTYIACMREGNFVTYSAVKSIEITSMPIKTEYTVGEYLDPTGMVVIATTYDGTTREITDSICPTCILEESTFIEIKYVEGGIAHTAIIPVTVNAFDAATVLVDFNYTANDDGTYTITGWKGTLNGNASTEMIIPDNGLIIV